MLCKRHLQLYGQYVPALLQLYEQYCPGYCAILTLACVEQNLSRVLNRFKIRWCHQLALAISPIVHPQRWDPDGPVLTGIRLETRLHPLLVSILAPWVPQIHLEAAISCLRYLQAGGHSVKSRKSLKPLLKSRYFTRLKMRPSLSRFRNRRHQHSSMLYFLNKEDLRSTWWKETGMERLGTFIVQRFKIGVLVPVRFFSYRSQYASSYGLWYTYRYALGLLPVFLANVPPDSQLASIAANCIFSSFCTAYPQETKEAKKSIAQYLSR